VGAERPRAALKAALAEQREGYEGEQRVAYERLARRADGVLVSAVGDAFRAAFVLAGALALLAAVALLAGGRGRGAPTRPAALAAVVVLFAGVPIAYALLHGAREPHAVQLADPCDPRELPGTGGIAGFLQDRALQALDATACRLGSSREELVLALASDEAAERFDERHGVDPRSAGSLLDGLIDP
jgi:hypothetical protein